MDKYLLLAIFSSFMLISTVAAQTERFTESEMALQEKFISAYKEKNLGKIDKAIGLFEEVYKADRKNATVAFELARAYAIKEDFENTKKYIDQACKNDPSNKWFQEFKVDFYKKTSESDGTIAALKQLVKLEPSNEKYAFELGELYESQNNSVFALEVYNKLQSNIGIYEETSRRKFEVYARLEDSNNAIAEITALSNAYPKNTRYLNNLASYYKEIGDSKNSEKIYQKVLTIEPENPDATIALAGDITQPGNEAAYLIALKTIINSPEVDIDTKIKELIPYVTNMSTDVDDKDNVALLQTIEMLQNVHPQEAKAYAIQADVLMNMGKLDKAIDKYAMTLSLDKSIFAVWQQYMYALEATERFEELSTVSNDALDLYPNQAICYYFNGVSQKRMGNNKISDDMFEEALIIARNNQDLKKRIQSIQAEDKTDEDYRTWAFMRGLKSHAPETLESYGDQLQEKGNLELAIKYWERAILRGADKKQIELKISSIKIK